MYNISLEKKVVMITGAAQGIGKEIALALAKAGCLGMCIIDIKKDENGEKTEAEIRGLGVEVGFILGDVAEESTIKEAIDYCINTWGHIDILVNNAGIAFMDTFETATVEHWDLVMRVNIRSMFLTMKLVSEVMKKQKSGVIINMSSIAGVTGGNTGPEYGASKAGVIALTKFGTKELGPYNIRVNAIAPGTIQTEMVRNAYSTLDEETVKKKLSTIPMNRMGDPSEVGKAALFLASDLASYVSGDVLLVTGGRST